MTIASVYEKYVRRPYESYVKIPLEAISLVAACVFFAVYLLEAEDRKEAARLQRLQIGDFCSSLASKVDGSQVWNWQEPRTFDEWDANNNALDKRIAWLNEQCATQPYYLPPTRMLRPDSEIETLTLPLNRRVPPPNEAVPENQE